MNVVARGGGGGGKARAKDSPRRRLGRVKIVIDLLLDELVVLDLPPQDEPRRTSRKFG